MRIVVIGATGNVGTSVMDSLLADASVEEIVAVARRRPETSWARTRFVAADVSRDQLEPILAGADAVIHLAWLIQPSRDRAMTRRVNVDGSRRVFEAVASAGVPALVYASSVGAYSAGPKSRAVDESWPTEGIPSSFYSVDKAAVERLLDRFETVNPSVRVVRLRPGLIFKREAATGVRRLFMGPLLPGAVVRPELLPVLPLPRGLRFQAVHSGDVGEAYRIAARSDASGAFNVAADPVLDAGVLGRLFSARPLEIAPGVFRRLASATWRLHLQPTPPGWLDMALGVPVMDCTRASNDLGWAPRRSSIEALEELLAGLREGGELPTPPLALSSSGRGRWRELATGVGTRPG
ncbi:MAG TPA: NAD-dependent epimerase/dehydratase family protein [Solirubrobacteraceae bacterium]|jgi:nucleoside-diphosphate-sugar epimerase|nr:NAD-dependent epimerase/dehydratase family protein [Solirubrobacteraceae bacterium]